MLLSLVTINDVLSTAANRLSCAFIYLRSLCILILNLLSPPSNMVFTSQQHLEGFVKICMCPWKLLMWMSSARRKRLGTFHLVERSPDGWEMRNIVLVQLIPPSLSSKAFSQASPCTPQPYVITPCYSVLLCQGLFPDNLFFYSFKDYLKNC